VTRFAAEHVGAADDLRHRVPDGVKTRDSLFWSRVLPDERIAVHVYIWVDGRGAAGRQVAVYGLDQADNVLLNAYDADLGPGNDLDDRECATLRVLRRVDPLPRRP